MTVIVREPDNTPFDNTDNPVVCWTRWGNDVPGSQADAHLITAADHDARRIVGAQIGLDVRASDAATPVYLMGHETEQRYAHQYQSGGAESAHQVAT